MTTPADLAIGSFSDSPPWIVDPEAMPWRRSVDAVRWVVRHEVPELTRPRRLPSGTRVVRVSTHLGLAITRWALGARREGGSASKSDLSRRLRGAVVDFAQHGQLFEDLGITYIGPVPGQQRKAKNYVPQRKPHAN